MKKRKRNFHKTLASAFKAHLMDTFIAKSLDTSDSGSTGNAVQGSPNAEDEGGVSPESGQPLDNGASHLEESKRKDRRRAKSLPAYADQEADYETIYSVAGRKRVQFADSVGQSLARVKHFSATDDPQVPFDVVSRLQSLSIPSDRGFFDSICGAPISALPLTRFKPAFSMPIDSLDFRNRVLRLRVTLEKVTVTQFDIRGLIRALTSGCSRKEVGVRYTFNDWLTFVDVQAIPLPLVDDAVDGEQFSFTLYTPPYFTARSSVHFAVYFRTGHGEFWDNNEQKNYTLRQEEDISDKN